MRTEKDIFYNEKCALDAYLPSVNGFSTILHFPGGGLVEGDNANQNNVEQNRLFCKALQFFYPQADITATLLPGEHCHGTVCKDEDGQYAFLKGERGL